MAPWNNIEITFDAHVDECGNDYNEVYVGAAYGEDYVMDEDIVWVNCILPVPSIEVEKWVKYKDESDYAYRKEIEDAKVCDNVTFMIVIHNNGDTSLTDISVTDELSISLGYRDNATVHFPDGTTAEMEPLDMEGIYYWYFGCVWLEPCEYINITFDAHVDVCGTDNNEVHVSAAYDEGDYVTDDDIVWVYCHAVKLVLRTHR